MAITIAKIGQFLNTPIGNTKSKAVKNSSNPFVSFKGNVLTADVFETKAAPRNKLTLSALVGSINDAFPTYRKAIESVVAFGNRMKEGAAVVAGKITDLGNTEVTIDFTAAGKAVKSGLTSLVDGYGVQRLRKYDVSSLESMWKEAAALNVAA